MKFSKHLLGACPGRGVEAMLGYLCERWALFSTVTCLGSEQECAGGGCLLKLGFFLILCP